MNYQQIFETLFSSMIIGIGTIGVSFIRKICDNISKLNHSIQELNTRMESVVIQLGFFRDTIEDHEKRLRDIETP